MREHIKKEIERLHRVVGASQPGSKVRMDASLGIFSLTVAERKRREELSQMPAAYDFELERRLRGLMSGERRPGGQALA